MKRLVALAVLGLLLSTSACPGQETPAPKPLTKEQRARAEERNRLWSEANKLEAAGKLNEAVATIEIVVVIQREVFGNVSTGNATALAYLAELPASRSAICRSRRCKRKASSSSSGTVSAMLHR